MGQQLQEFEVQDEWYPEAGNELRLTLTAVDKLQRVLELGDREEVLVDHNHVVRIGDLAKLRGNELLNDVIINEYLEMIGNSQEGVKVLDLFFYIKLDRRGEEQGYEDLRSWIKQDLITYRTILTPILNNEH